MPPRDIAINIVVLIVLFLRDLLCGEFLQKQPVCLWDWRGQWLSRTQGQVLLHLPQVSLSVYGCGWGVNVCECVECVGKVWTGEQSIYPSSFLPPLPSAGDYFCAG